MATTITGSGVDNIIDGTIVDADVNESSGIVIKDSNGNVGIGNSGSTDRNFHIKSSNDDYNGILIQTKELASDNGHSNRNTRYYINFHGASTVAPSPENTNNTSYYHLKTNIPTTNPSINTMYRFETKGYSYGISEFIDCDSVGYAYGVTGTILAAANTSFTGNVTTTTYMSQDNFLVLRVYVGTSSYYAGMQFSARFTNPTGHNWNLKVLESIWTNNSSTTGTVY